MLFAVAALIVAVIFAWTDNTAPTMLLTAVMLIVLVFIFSFFQMTYEIHNDKIIGKFWPFSLKVDYKDIKSIEIGKVPWYVGVGFRFGPGFRVMNTRYGSAIHIKRKDGVNVYYTPNNPAEFIQRAKNMMKR